MQFDELIQLRNNGLPCIPVSTPSAKETERQQLQQEIAEFLARGGQIEEVSPRRMKALPQGAFNNQPINKQKTRAGRRKTEFTFGVQACEQRNQY